MNELEALKDWLQEHLDDLKDRDSAHAQDLNDLYQQATIAYEQSLNATLAPTDEVRDLTAQLATIQADITHAMDQNDDIAGIIGKITTGVGIASKIVGLLIKP
jgi:predicted  nucleic acid-binding Zn-ribbon protein